MRKHAMWLDLQDIPEIIVRMTATATAARVGCGESSVRKEISGGGGVSAPTTVKKATQRLAMTRSVFGSNSNYSASSRVLRPPSGDDIFVMDDHEPQATTSTITSDVPPMSMNVAPQASPPVWKVHGISRYVSFVLLGDLLNVVHRVDMKAVMAEAAAAIQTARYLALFNSPRSSVMRGATTSVPNEASPSKAGLSKTLTSTPTALPLTWRAVPDPNAATARGLVLPATPPTPSPRTNSDSTPSKDTTLRLSSVAGPSTKPQPQPPTPARSQLPGLGPVITPSRQVLSKPGPSSSRGAGSR